MNGYRIARKSIKRMTDDELIGVQKISKYDTSYEGIVIHYLIEREMEERKILTIPKEEDPRTEKLYNLYIRGIITDKQLLEYLK